MWLKLINTSTIPAKEYVIPENYLLSCDYRKGADGRTVISLMRQLIPNDQANLLENKINDLWKLEDCQIDLYSGDGLLKTMRGCPYSYSMTDRGNNGLTVERAEILVGGKTMGGTAQNSNGNNGVQYPLDDGSSGTGVIGGGSNGDSRENTVELSPFVYKATYDKGNGRLTAYTNHSLHSWLGIFTAVDFEISKISVNGVALVAGDVQLDVYRTSHDSVVFTVAGATKIAVDESSPSTGTNNGAYKLVCGDGWNHLVSEKQETVLEVSNTGTTSTATKITRMVYDIPSAIMTLFTNSVFASTRTDGSYQSSDFDASRITIGGVHSFAWTNTQFVSSSAGMAKIQILGNCVDFMNNYATANGTKGDNGNNYTWDARAGWNTGASTDQVGILEITGYVDYKAPEAPVGFRAMSFDSSVHLMAEMANKETDLAGYNYYVDGVKSNATPYPDFMYDVRGLLNGKNYNFAMTAVDRNGNESPMTEVITVAPRDSLSPSVPSNVTAMNSLGAVHLMWNQLDGDVVGYNVYIDGVKYNTVMLETNMIDVEIANTESHNYAVTAVDSSGNESPRSDIVAFALS